MKRRPFGNTGLTVSEIGLGAWQLANPDWGLHDRGEALVPPGTSLTHAALQFILAHAEVSTVIPGAKTVAQALDNFAAAQGQLPAEVVQAIRELWEREIAADPLPW